MLRLMWAQEVDPDMVAFTAPSTVQVYVSALSEADLQSNWSVVGPITVALRVDDLPSGTSPLCKASPPLMLWCTTGTQDDDPDEV
jgi:hypothetical protein